MMRLVIAIALALGSIAGLPTGTRGASLDTAGLGCSVPSAQLPSFVAASPTSGGAVVTYHFAASGQQTTTCGDVQNSKGVAANFGYSSTITGTWTRWGGTADEKIVISVSGMPTDYGSYNGTYSYQIKLKCPADPWLYDVTCTVVGTPANQLWDGGNFKGPFPVSRDLVPETKKAPLMAQSAPLTILAPKGVSVSPGGTVTVQVKAPSVPSLPTTTASVTFKPSGQFGDWPGADWITETMTVAPGQVSTKSLPAGKFTDKPGDWQVVARLDVAGAPDSPPGTFTVAAGGGASPSATPAPGSRGEGGQAASARTVPGSTGVAQPPLTARARPSGPPSPSPLRRVPLKLLSAQQRGGDLVLVLLNPEGNAPVKAEEIELRLGGRILGRGTVRDLVTGREHRLSIRPGLPAAGRGPARVEIWAGGAKLGVADFVPPTARTP
jgi:hypothetical protein